MIIARFKINLIFKNVSTKKNIFIFKYLYDFTFISFQCFNHNYSVKVV